MLFLKVLGSLSVQSDAGPVSAASNQKRRLGLLALLAVAGRRGISRERIQAYLWPESPSDRARHALDQLTYAIRRSLGADPIISEGRDLKLNPSVVRSDLADFDAAFDEGRWEDAVASHSGPLLDGFHLSDSRDLEGWIDAERARIEGRYQSALESLAKSAWEQGDRTRSIAWWKKLGVTDPLSSRVALEIIRALADAGESPAAIQHARSYQQLVRKELEIEPDPRIEELVESLYRNEAGDPVVPDPQQVARLSKDFIPAEPALPRNPIRPAFSRAGSRWRIAGIGIVAAAVLVVGTLVSSQRARARTPEEARSSARAKPEAQAFYLRGVSAWNDRSKEGLDRAVVNFRRAVELDPAYPEAYAGLANAYVLLGYSGYRPANAMFPKAKAAAVRAMELDSALAPAHSALALELTWERQFAAAEAAFRRAIALDPEYATAHQWYGMLLMILGNVDEAVTETRRAAELDPLSLQIQNTYATFLSASGDEAAALRQYEKAAGEEPDSAWVRRNPWLLTNMSAVYAANGMWAKAIRFAEQAVAVAPGHPRAQGALASVYARMGRVDTAKVIFSQADTTNEHYTAQRALFFFTLGQKDSAFALLDRISDWPIPVLISLGSRTDLRPDPRYQALQRRIGIPSRRPQN